MKRLAVLVFVVVGVGIMHAPMSGATIAKPTIHFVGDSITAGATPGMSTFFGDSITGGATFKSYFGHSYRYHGAPAYAVTVHAYAGFDTRFDAGFVYADALTHPTVEVINLGTNDVLYAKYGGVKYADIFHRFNVFGSHALFPHNCVVFVNVNTHSLSRDPAGATYLNAHLAGFAHVVDWAGAWKASYFDVGDDVHPNALGQHVLVHLIDVQVAKCGRP